MYKNVQNAWSHNFRVFKRNRVKFFEDIFTYLLSNSPAYFRWHVSGDIQDQDYLEQMKAIAVQFPGTKFLAFTKQLDLDFSNLPKNLTIVASMWTNWGNPKDVKLPKAWFQDGSENRIPKNAYVCIRDCSQCYVCWGLGKKGKHKHVILNKH